MKGVMMTGSNYNEAFEYAILNTLLSIDKAMDRDIDNLLNHKLDYTQFKANKTTALVAKAIFNHLEKDIPFDSVLIERYILKRTDMNMTEWLDIIGRLWVTYETMKAYEITLKELNNEAKLKELINEI